MGDVMSMVLEETVAEVLRGDRTKRPAADTEIAGQLRTTLDDRCRALVPPGRTVRLTGSDIRRTAGTPVDSAPSARLRGVLITHVLALLTVGYPVVHPFADALTAWRAEDDHSDLATYVSSLRGDDLARVATDVDAHGVVLAQRLGAISPRWWPRVGGRASLRLADGRVALLDVVDLTVGSAASEHASVALLDVTTSPLSEVHHRLLRYHALCETVRSGVAPLRVAALSTATGELASVDVDRDLLETACEEVLDVVTRTLA